MDLKTLKYHNVTKNLKEGRESEREKKNELCWKTFLISEENQIIRLLVWNIVVILLSKSHCVLLSATKAILEMRRKMKREVWRSQPKITSLLYKKKIMFLDL